MLLLLFQKDRKKEELVMAFFILSTFLATILLRAISRLSVFPGNLTGEFVTANYDNEMKWLMYLRYNALYCGVIVMYAMNFLASEHPRKKKVLGISFGFSAALTLVFLLWIGRFLVGVDSRASIEYYHWLPTAFMQLGDTFRWRNFIYMIGVAFLVYGCIALSSWKKVPMIGMAVFGILNVYIYVFITVNVHFQNVEANESRYNVGAEIARELSEQSVPPVFCFRPNSTCPKEDVQYGYGSCSIIVREVANTPYGCIFLESVPCGGVYFDLRDFMEVCLDGDEYWYVRGEELEEVVRGIASMRSMTYSIRMRPRDKEAPHFRFTPPAARPAE